MPTVLVTGTTVNAELIIFFPSGTRWLGGVVVRALDLRWAGREFDSHAAAALSGNNLGQVVHSHTNVPLFTKRYNLVPCEGLYA